MTTKRPEPLLIDELRNALVARQDRRRTLACWGFILLCIAGATSPWWFPALYRLAYPVVMQAVGR